MTATILTSIITFCVTFEATCLIQAYFHQVVGHGRWLRWIGRSHRESHHRVYSASNFEAPDYSRHEDSIEYTYIPAGIAVILLAHALLPVIPGLVAFATVPASIWMHNYLHKQYHLTNSWLLRFAWFRRKRELHWIHHRDYRTNFGVLHHLWDRLLHTYAAPGSHPGYEKACPFAAYFKA